MHIYLHDVCTSERPEQIMHLFTQDTRACSSNALTNIQIKTPPRARLYPCGWCSAVRCSHAHWKSTPTNGSLQILTHTRRSPLVACAATRVHPKGLFMDSLWTGGAFACEHLQNTQWRASRGINKYARKHTHTYIHSKSKRTALALQNQHTHARDRGKKCFMVFGWKSIYSYIV